MVLESIVQVGAGHLLAAKPLPEAILTNKPENHFVQRVSLAGM